MKGKALNQLSFMQLRSLGPQPVTSQENRLSVILNQGSCPDRGGGLKNLSVITIKVPACLIFSYSERCEVSYGSQEELTPQTPTLVGQSCCPA